MNIDRRDFIKISAATGVTAAIPQVAKGLEVPDPPQTAKLKLSCQEGITPGETLEEKFDFLEEHGFVGVEPGGRDLPNRVEEFQKALKGRNIKISAICAGFKGVIISEKEDALLVVMARVLR